MEERADPSKVVISNRGFTGGGFVDWVKEGRLKLTDRRAVGPKQKSDVWDANFIASIVAGMHPGLVVIDQRTEPYRVLDGNGRIGAVVDFLNGDLHNIPSDLGNMSTWDFSSLGEYVIKRKVREATFTVVCILPGTGDKEFEVLAQSLQVA